MSVPVGTILPYGGNVGNPATVDRLKDQGWLVCDGSSYDRGDKNYQELFDVIGYAFGRDGDSMFRVPDLRGRFVRGVDNCAGRDPDAKQRTSEHCGNKGDRVGSVQEDAFKKHKHEFKETERHIGGGDGGLFSGGRHGRFRDEAPEAGDSCETRPKNIYVNWIIRAR